MSNENSSDSVSMDHMYPKKSHHYRKRSSVMGMKVRNAHTSCVGISQTSKHQKSCNDYNFLSLSSHSRLSRGIFVLELASGVLGGNPNL